jgi:hypothetical protein
VLIQALPLDLLLPAARWVFIGISLSPSPVGAGSGGVAVYIAPCVVLGPEPLTFTVGGPGDVVYSPRQTFALMNSRQLPAHFADGTVVDEIS